MLTFTNGLDALFQTLNYSNIDPHSYNKNFSIDVPGFDKDNLQVEYSNNLLYLKGEVSDEFDKRSINKVFKVSSEPSNIKIDKGILYVEFAKPKLKILNQSKTKMEAV